MPLPSEPVRLPFRFSGGFDLSTKSVGTILSFLGFFAMINQIYLCPKILSKKGALPTFRMVAIFFPIIYLFVPFTVLLPASIRLPAIIFCHALKISSAALAYPSNTMLITNSVSTTLVLGMVNGVGASAASLARAIGPLVTGFIHSKGLELGYNGLAWWCAALVAIIAAFECLLMQETKGRLDTETDGDACIPMDAGTIS
ncbi:MAG: hypothetical protein M1829_003947 [Trizodia sp. TS-e1964]|nr:MAG: hypothetical protein M1829_003947 [Trizodia sp. TS-e1964]